MASKRPPKGSHRLRLGRRSLENQVYLVTTSTEDRRPLFDNLGHGRIVVRAIMREAQLAETLAFVIMPDHIHWLVRLRGSRPLSRCVNTVKSHSARQFNTVTGRHIRVWQRGFHDHAVRNDEGLENIARYVVLNPVRAGLVKSVRDYPLWDAIWV
jgi:REP element-mobilizing transposase RayT